MSWLYSQALVAASSAANSSAGELSAPSSGSPIPQAFSSPDRMMAFSRLSRFGMTFAPLTDTLGADVLTWCLADSLARTSAPPGRAQESTAAAPACGPTWRGSLAKFDPASCSWKTAQLSLLEDLAESLETWPRSGLMLRGECFPLLTLEHRTVESGSGLSGVPDGVRFFHTPNTGGLDGGSNSRRALAARQWPTPTVCGNYNRKGASATSGDGLATAVIQSFRTPNATDGAKWSNQTQAEREAKGQQVRLGHQLGAGGSLNPTWVEWLMGWPLGWTDLNPLATDKCPSAPPPPGESLPATLHELDGRET